MYQDDDYIDVLGLIAIAIIGIFSIQILRVPRELADMVGPDGWFVILVFTAISGVLMAIGQKLADLRPKESIVGLAATILGKPLGTIWALALSGMWVVHTARVVTVSTEMVRLSLLDRTPIIVISTGLLLSAAVLARQGIEPVARMAIFIAMVAVILAIVIPLLSWSDINWLNLKPVLFGGPWEEFKASFLVLGSTKGLLLPSMFYPFLRATEKEKRRMLPAILLPTGLATLVFSVISVTVLGVRMTVRSVQPALQIVSSIEMPTLFLERLTVFFVGAWILLTLMNLSILLYVTSITLGDIFGLKDTRPVPALLVPILVLTTIVPVNPIALRSLERQTDLYSVVFFLSFPLLYIIGRLRGLRPQQSSNKGS